MHRDEIEIDDGLVRRLIAAQFPRWRDRPVARVADAGTDHAIFRLGDDLAIRLPRIPSAARQVEKEQRWLPELAPQLPLPVPVPLGAGVPGEGYPWAWTVCRWLDGVGGGRLDPSAADELAAFVAALQRLDPAGGPPPGEHNFFRGAPLATRDGAVRDALSRLDGSTLDVAAAGAAWEQALEAPVHTGRVRWIHGDLHPANLLALEGRMAGVLDFGGLGVGDPACDLMAAWTVLDAAARPAFRAGVAADDASWARGRGWALSVGLIALPYYRDRSPAFAAEARRWVDAALDD